jgi:hypothetical protein
VGPSIKEGNNVAGRRIRRKQTGLSSEKVAGGRDGIAERENLKNSKVKKVA